MFGLSHNWLLVIGVLSLATVVGSTVALPWLVTRLPEDFLVEPDPPVLRTPSRHRLLSWVWRGLRNLLGVVLLLSGFVMLFTPGQGVLTILVGLGLVDLPGKRRWERRLIGRPQVLASINWIRRQAGRPPLRVPQSTE